MNTIRQAILILSVAALSAGCGGNSCPENCIRVTGFVKDSSTNGGAAYLPYEVYWVKKKAISKFADIDTGSTDANGRMDKSFPIDKNRFKDQRIFVRLLPDLNKNYRQAKGTIITQVIEDDVPSKDFKFTVLQNTDLTVHLKQSDPNKAYAQFLLSYNCDGNEYKVAETSGVLKKTEYKIRTAAGVKTVVSAFIPNNAGILKRYYDSIVCVPGKPNAITINLEGPGIQN